MKPLSFFQREPAIVLIALAILAIVVVALTIYFVPMDPATRAALVGVLAGIVGTVGAAIRALVTPTAKLGDPAILVRAPVVSTDAAPVVVDVSGKSPPGTS